MSMIYHPDVAAKAVMELSHALRGFKNMEYANALLCDPRMTNTKGALASCGFSYKEIKMIRDQVSGNLPTLEAQRSAIEFLSNIDQEQRRYG